MPHIFVDSYEDGTGCVRFDGRGQRLTRAQLGELAEKLRAAIEDLDARSLGLVAEPGERLGAGEDVPVVP